MNRLFGTSASVPKPTLTSAIAATDLRIDGLEVKIKKLDLELTKFRDQLKKLREGPGKAAVQQRALRILKQKKVYESQIDQLVAQNFNLEQTEMTTESLRATILTVDAMKVASKEMKKAYGNVNLSKIESMQDEMEDLMEMSAEVSETMSRSYGVPDELDEADLDAELEALGDDFAEEEGIPSYLQDNVTSALPDFVDELPTSAMKEPNERMGAGVV